LFPEEGDDYMAAVHVAESAARTVIQFCGALEAGVGKFVLIAVARMYSVAFNSRPWVGNYSI
jgi:hypothetical protein